MKRFYKWGDTVKNDIEGWLREIGVHLAEAEKAVKEGNATLAETAVLAAREKLRHAQAAATLISN